MRYLKYAALLGLLLMIPAGNTLAQVRFGIGIGVGPGYYGPYGPPPVCTYGYFDYYPYACAPYGYYGPDYFYNGIFIGVGPWFHPGWYGGRYYARGWDRDGRFRGGFRGNSGFRGNGAFQGGGGFRGNSGFRGNAGVRGNGGFQGGGGFRGGNSSGFRGGAAGGFHGGGGGGFHGGGHGGGHR